jgi:hypothetical protein
MSMWEWNCAVAGYLAANRTEEEPPPPMDDERLSDVGIVGF